MAVWKRCKERTGVGDFMIIHSVEIGKLGIVEKKASV